MKMIDVGTKHSDMGMPIKEDKNKIYYPSFTVDKDMGMKMGQKVHLEGVVSGLRKDKHGSSTTIEVHKCGMGNKMSDNDFEKMNHKEQEEYIEKQKPR